jgi:peptidoglycan-N-acetylmuramic acid deacetylase
MTLEDFIKKYNAYYVNEQATDEKVIYLTFDAGYENGNVEKILNILRDEKIPAAFFILEHLITNNGSLVCRMAEEGHLVCNHTARHRNMTLLHTREEFAAELSALESVYEATTEGKMAKYYRPPEGTFSEENLQFAKELGYKTVMWSVAYADWDNAKQPTPEYAMKKLMGRMHNGAVILLHPTSETNVKILPLLITTLRKEGYRFGTLDELTQNEA